MDKILNYQLQLQINGWYCGPAAVRCALTVQGWFPSQAEVANHLRTTTAGTNSCNDVVRALNAYWGGPAYSARFITTSTMSAAQIDQLRIDIQDSIGRAGDAIVANVVGTIRTNDGSSYSYNDGHYVTLVGYRNDGMEVLVADINVRAYWVSIHALATWIAGRGYSYSLRAPAVVVPPPVIPPVPTPLPPPGDVIFGVDLSDFDSDRGNTPAIVSQYRAAGISFLTHKITEWGSGTVTVHRKAGGMLTAGRDSGIPFLGGYIVCRSGRSVEDQVAEYVKQLDSMLPWWRTFPGFFHQVDLERWEYDAVSADVGNVTCDILRGVTRQPVLLYASKGQYGNSNLSQPRWNANYPTEAAMEFKALYASVGGNTGPGWVMYGAPTVLPKIWQYSSKAIVAGQGTTDVNAFRGPESDFAKMLLTGKGIVVPTVDDAHFEALIWRVSAIINNNPTVQGGPTKGEINQIFEQFKALKATPAGSGLTEVQAVEAVKKALREGTV